MSLLEPDFQRCRFLATAARGTETAVARELEALGIGAPPPAEGGNYDPHELGPAPRARVASKPGRTRVVPGGVEFAGTIEDGMRACLWLRTANRVLLELGGGTLRHERHLYAAVRSLPLDRWFTPDHTISVYTQARGEVVKNSQFASLKAKDAIVDDIRERTGRRPNVDKRDANIVFVQHIIDGDVRFYIELNGAPLNQRGYRRRDVVAPLKETLAAALLVYARWDGKRPLHDPVCGSGTLVFEAAMMATDTAPGLRRGFGFQHWPHYPTFLETRWGLLMDEAKERQRRAVRGVIIGSDNHQGSIHAARVNLAALDIDNVILREGDARKLEPLIGDGLFVLNPPYGERLGRDAARVADLHRELGEAIARCPRHHAAIITTAELLQSFGLPIVRSARVYNGRLPCRFAFCAADALPAAHEPPDLEPPAHEPPA